MRLALVMLAISGTACGDERPGASDSTIVKADTASVAPTFEIGLWPGEGIPVIQAAGTTLVLLHEPREGARVTGVMSTSPGEQLSYDSTRYQTTAPALSRAIRASTVRGRDMGVVRYLTRDQYYSGSFQDSVLRVSASESIEYLQPRAEGTCFVRIRGRVYETDPCPVFDATAFTPAADPRTLWWIYVTGPEVSGWLPLTDTTATVVNRTF